MSPVIHFPEYAPDLSPFESDESNIIQNVYPRKDGYQPVPTPSFVSAALTGPNRGYFYARNADATISVFAATGTKLWLFNNATFTWTDVSKGAGTYPAVPPADQWQFAQFNNFVFAVQTNTVVQVYDLTSSSAFADLAGSPPVARYVAVVGRFLVLSGLGSSTPYRIQWSGLNATTTWTSGVNSSDFQDLPDGGPVRGVAGGEFGIIMQDNAIRLMTFVGGVLVFQIQRISQDRGIAAPLSLCQAGERVFFLGVDGFKMYVPGNYPGPIGKEKVDRTFFGDVDLSSLSLIQGASDPSGTRIFFAYKSTSGVAGLFDKVLVYDYVLDRWSLIKAWMGQAIVTLARPGLTLENMDALSPGIITISGAVNNGSGLIRLTISGLTAGVGPSNTNLNIENTIEVYGVVGTTEANGNWHFTIIDPTHIDLIGSAFVHAYGSGGAIGGSLDQLPFSLDSLATAATVSLSMFDSSNRLCFMNGPPAEALLDTSEHEEDNNLRMRVQGLRPITDATGCFGSIGTRETTQSPIIYSSERVVQASNGRIPMNVATRMARGRLRVPAGTAWTFATGYEAFTKQEGQW